MKQFSVCIEEALFKLSAHRDRALNYKVEDVQITAIDELFVDQNSQGSVLKQIARVRLFFLAFMCGEFGVNFQFEITSYSYILLMMIFQECRMLSWLLMI